MKTLINKKIRIAIYLRLLIFFSAFLLPVLSILAPIRQSLQGFPNGETIYRFLSLICHQYPPRSFWILGFPCGLCSRCLFGYVGIALAALLISWPHRYLRHFILGLLLLSPGIIDVFAQLMTPYQSTNLVRAITGFIGGIGLFMILFPFNFFSRRTRKT